MDYTGTGNTLNMRHPHVLQMVMDSLRYWVTDMHVDGFRFDLASTLARGLHKVDRLSAFFLGDPSGRHPTGAPTPDHRPLDQHRYRCPDPQGLRQLS